MGLKKTRKRKGTCRSKDDQWSSRAIRADRKQMKVERKKKQVETEKKHSKGSKSAFQHPQRERMKKRENDPQQGMQVSHKIKTKSLTNEWANKKKERGRR